MNICILANRDIAACFALNLLANSLAQHKVSLMLSKGIGSAGNKAPGLQDLADYESRLGQAACDSVGENKLLNFEILAQHHHWHLAEASDANSEMGIRFLQQQSPDLILSIRYGHILKPKAISRAKLAVINVHSGDLPSYRGVMASFWAMLKQESQLASSLHYIDSAEIDRGSVIAKHSIPLNPKKSYLWHVLNLYPTACYSIINCLDTFAQQTLPNSKPAIGKEGYFSFPKQPEINRFTEQGFALFKEQEFDELIDLLRSSRSFIPV